MTKFNNLVTIPEKKIINKTVFTHHINLGNMKITNATMNVDQFDCVDYLGCRYGTSFFRAINKFGEISFYLGKKGDEFE